MLEDSQRTRYDVDRVDASTVTKQIDNYPSLASPFIKDILEYYSSSRNVFYVNDDDDLECNSFNGSDTLVFNVDLREMLMKIISGMELSFHIVADSPVTINQVGIANEISTYNPIENSISGESDVCVSIDLSQTDYDELVYLMEAQRFQVFVDVTSKMDVASIVISDMSLSCTFTNRLQDEIDAVNNRVMVDSNFIFDDFVTHDELNNLPDLEDGELEHDVGEYLDEVISRLYVDVDVELGLSGIDDSIRIITEIKKEND